MITFVERVKQASVEYNNIKKESKMVEIKKLMMKKGGELSTNLWPVGQDRHNKWRRAEMIQSFWKTQNLWTKALFKNL